ncbi:Protein of unknown function [Gryllus bimaculatus]|nr:Protein of unknown function [Gryllus bimaculatus]
MDNYPNAPDAGLKCWRNTMMQRFFVAENISNRIITFAQLPPGTASVAAAARRQKPRERARPGPDEPARPCVCNLTLRRMPISPAEYDASFFITSTSLSGRTNKMV